MKTLFTVFALMLVSFSMRPALADRSEVPCTGFVIDTGTGEPLTGSHTVTCRFFEASEGGTALAESTEDLSVSEGFFALYMSPPASPPDTLFLEVEIDGTVLSPRGRVASVVWSQTAVSSDTVVDAIGTSLISDSAVTSAKIADATIAGGDLSDSAVTSAKIADATIASGDLSDSAVTSAKIADATIAAADLASDSVTSAKISDGTVTSADVGTNLDFVDLDNTLDLDASLTVNQGTNTWSQDFAGTSQGPGLIYTADDLTTSSGMDINITRAHNADASYSLMTLDLENRQTTANHTGTNRGVGVDIGYTQDPATGITTGFDAVLIQNRPTSDTDDTSVSSLLTLDNADTSASGETLVNSALRITNSGNIDGGISFGIDIDDTDIGQDIKLQNGEIITNGTNGEITFNADGGNIARFGGTLLSLDLGDQIGGTAQRLCHGGADGAGTLVSIGDCGGTQADLAEYYGSDGTLQPGELVVPGAESFVVSTPTGGPSSKAFVVRSTPENRGPVLGVVSTNPFGEVLGEGILGETEHPVPVALVGRVPTKVTDEGGPIEVRDYLAPSVTRPGYAMKANAPGPVIGFALSSLKRGAGKVIASLQPGYYGGEPQTKRGVSQSGEAILNGGDDTTWVYFAREMTDPPYVVATPQGNPGSFFWVSDVTEKGFALHLAAPAPADLVFHFIATEN